MSFLDFLFYWFHLKLFCAFPIFLLSCFIFFFSYYIYLPLIGCVSKNFFSFMTGRVTISYYFYFVVVYFPPIYFIYVSSFYIISCFSFRVYAVYILFWWEEVLLFNICWNLFFLWYIYIILYMLFNVAASGRATISWPNNSSVQSSGTIIQFPTIRGFIHCFSIFIISSNK